MRRLRPSKKVTYDTEAGGGQRGREAGAPAAAEPAADGATTQEEAEYQRTGVRAPKEAEDRAARRSKAGSTTAERPTTGRQRRDEQRDHTITGKVRRLLSGIRSRRFRLFIGTPERHELRRRHVRHFERHGSIRGPVHPTERRPMGLPRDSGEKPGAEVYDRRPARKSRARSAARQAAPRRTLFAWATAPRRLPVRASTIRPRCQLPRSKASPWWGTDHHVGDHLLAQRNSDMTAPTPSQHYLGLREEQYVHVRPNGGALDPADAARFTSTGL